MTFPAREDQGPAQAPTQYPGVNNTVSYDEDIYVGYRYYDQNGQEPLFPFGYGHSYTTFSLDGLRVSGRSGGGYDVSVTVTNTGSRKGAAVVQLYVGFPTSAQEPPRQLRGFAKVMLNSGQQEVVDMALDGPSFATWSTTDHAFVVLPGTYQIQVGTSSRDLPLETAVVLP
jgi:beta-glucosidase